MLNQPTPDLVHPQDDAQDIDHDPKDPYPMKETRRKIDHLVDRVWSGELTVEEGLFYVDFVGPL